MVRSLDRLIAFAVAATLLAPALPGETPGSTQQAAGAAEAALPQPPSRPDTAGVMTLHTRSNLVVVDVVVQDSKGNPVHGLTKADFTLTESGKPQILQTMDEHTAAEAADEAKLTQAPKLPPGLFSNIAPTPSGPVNVLLLDYLNTPLTDQPYARKQLIEFLNKTPPGTRIAIFAITTQLTMLQGFTSDPEVLKAALISKKGAPQASDILTDPVNGGPQGDTTLSTTFQSDALDAAQQLANIERAQAIEAAFEQDLRTKVTLSAFDLLARYLVGIPGRKNVIWFSGSFPLSVEPNTDVDNQDAFDSVVRNDDEVRKTDNLLTRAQIAVYPVDARGVFNNGANSAINGANTPGNMGGQGMDPESQMNFLQQTAQEHETMEAMAEDTGGHAFINTNNLALAVQKAVENGSNYYTLTYVPSNRTWDGRFRAIKIKVDQPGLKLAYRNGYYADDPEDKNKVVAGSSAMSLSRPATMTTAMLRGAPEPTQILMKVRIRPAATPPEEQPVRGSKLNPDPKVKVEGPYKQYGVDLVPAKNSINCPVLPDGNHQCAIELSTYVYNRDGQLIVASTARTSATLSAANYAKMQQTGMAFHQEVSVPVKGVYYLRTGLHDLMSDRVGAVEVPVASVAHLQPLDPLPAVAGPVKVPTTPTAAPAGSSSPFAPPAAGNTIAPAVPAPVPGTPASAPASTPAPPR